MIASFRYYEKETGELPVDLVKDLYLETRNSKALVFPNNRGTVEEVAVKLKKLSMRIKGHPYYFSHHSSVNKDVREYVEFFAKESKRENFCISCTSTLELGIDIGSLDKVVQIDSTHSVASLIQRIGRSGRNASQDSNLLLYATNQWSLLQSLACYELYQEGFIEPPRVISKSYDILLHQALSIVKGRSGINQSTLVEQLKRNTAFANIAVPEIEEIVEHVIKIGFFEKLGRELIIGVDGEPVVNSRNFYTVFQTSAEYVVSNRGNKIGSIPFSPSLREDENILLAARIWKIKLIDHESMRIEVVVANDGKPPRFSGGFGKVHPRVREKMLEIVLGGDIFDYLSDSAILVVRELRRFFSNFKIGNRSIERPFHTTEKKQTLYTFAGTGINRTIGLLLNFADVEHRMNSAESSFEFDLTKQDVLAKWEGLVAPLSDIEPHIKEFEKRNPGFLQVSKWSQYLPINYRVKLFKQRELDVTGTVEFMNRISLVENLGNITERVNE